MTSHNLMQSGWSHVKQYWLAVLAAGLMFGGVDQIILVAKYRVTGVILLGVNLLIKSGFRDRMPLPNSFLEMPWHFHILLAATGLIGMVLGVFVGLWANTRVQRAASQ